MSDLLVACNRCNEQATCYDACHSCSTPLCSECVDFSFYCPACIEKDMCGECGRADPCIVCDECGQWFCHECAETLPVMEDDCLDMVLCGSCKLDIKDVVYERRLQEYFAKRARWDEAIKEVRQLQNGDSPMGYSLDLDEISSKKLLEELVRREKCQDNGLCDYCERALRSEPICKFPVRHGIEEKKAK